MVSGSSETAGTIRNPDAQIFRHYFAASGASLRCAPRVDLNRLSGGPLCLAGEKIKEQRQCRVVDISVEDPIFSAKHLISARHTCFHGDLSLPAIIPEVVHRYEELPHHDQGIISSPVRDVKAALGITDAAPQKKSQEGVR